MAARARRNTVVCRVLRRIADGVLRNAICPATGCAVFSRSAGALAKPAMRNRSERDHPAKCLSALGRGRVLRQAPRAEAARRAWRWIDLPISISAAARERVIIKIAGDARSGDARGTDSTIRQPDRVVYWSS